MAAIALLLISGMAGADTSDPGTPVLDDEATDILNALVERLPTTLEPAQRALSAARPWLDYADGLSRPSAADRLRSRPGPDLPASFLGLANDDVRRLRERLGPELASGVLQVRQLQVSLDDPSERAAEVADVARAMAELLQDPSAFQPVLDDDTLCLFPYGNGDGAICITGTQNGTYDSFGDDFGSFRGIFIDLGGSDTYSSGFQSFGTAQGIFIDLGGDDSYTGSGSSFGFNDGIFVDVAGSDSYTADGSTTFGASRGTFLELGGSDTYDSDDKTFGMGGGQFIDVLGNDVYAASFEAFGFSLGGTFLDAEGDDVYDTTSGRGFGISQGLFIDGKGNDDYEVSGGFCCSGSFGSDIGGLFVELGGDDTYISPWSGFGFSISAVFLEAAGDDQYVGGSPSFGAGTGGSFYEFLGDDWYSASNGFGSGLASVFYDYQGSDHYSASSNAFGTAIGTFVDHGGNDQYGISGFGGAFGSGTAGSFLDIGGEDLYPTTSGFGSSLAVFYDSEDPGAPTKHNRELSVNAGPTKPANDVPSLTTSLLQAVADQVDVSLDILPNVGRINATAQFQVVINARIPVRLFIHDDAGVPLTLTPTGTVPGLDGVYFTAGQDVTLNATYQPLEAGLRSFELVVRDPQEAHSIERLSAGPFEVDAIPPRLKFKFDDGAGSNDLGSFHSENTTAAGLNISVEDRQSGAWKFYVSEGSPPTVDDPPIWIEEPGEDGRGVLESPQHRITLNALSEADHTFHVLAFDAVGNVAAGNATLRIDRSQPGVSAYLSEGQMGLAGWYTEAPHAIVNATDSRSGVAMIDFEWDGATREDPDPLFRTVGPGETDTVDLSPAAGFAAGHSWLDVVVSDNAHAPNEAVRNRLLDVKFDPDPPTTTDDLVPDPILRSPLGITLEGHDAVSGVSRTYHKLWKTEAPEPAAFYPSSRLTIPKAGAWNLAYYSTDVAGNKGPTVTKNLLLQTTPPAADFAASLASALTNVPITFTDTSTDIDGLVLVREWDFGDSTSSSETAPTHSYANDGDYVVQLRVTDDDGATSTASRTITVQNRQPTAAFRFAPNPVRLELPVQFDDLSNDPDGQVVAWSWTFGDGQASAARSPVHSYESPGVYTVVLRVTDDDGATHTRSALVTAVRNVAPLAAFYFTPPQPTKAETVEFLDTSTDDVATAGWNWDFGDGKNSTARNPTHKYAAPGSYEVRLQVTDDEGVTNTTTALLVVSTTRPAGDFTVSDATPSVGQPVHFNATASDPGSAITSYAWDFDDGSTATGARVVHSFKRSGLENVVLKVRNQDGGLIEISKFVTVANVEPTAQFTFASSSPSYLHDVEFQDRSTDVGGHIVAWRWVFGDGTSSTDPSPRHRFPGPGTYAVELSVTDFEGAVGRLAQDVVRTPVAPKADFGLPATLAAGELVPLVDLSSDPDGQIKSWTWTFGDSTTAAGPAPTHRYDRTGSYTVKLTVVDDHGAQATATRTVTVVAPSGYLPAGDDPGAPASSTPPAPNPTSSPSPVPTPTMGHQPESTAPTDSPSSTQTAGSPSEPATAAEQAPAADSPASGIAGSLAALSLISFLRRRRHG